MGAYIVCIELSKNIRAKFFIDWEALVAHDNDVDILRVNFYIHWSHYNLENVFI